MKKPSSGNAFVSLDDVGDRAGVGGPGGEDACM